MMLNSGGAKFEVTRFDRTCNFDLWKMRVKDLLAHKVLHKVLRDEKSTDITTINWNEIKDKATGLMGLCISYDEMNHILDLTTPKDVWEKLEN